MENLGKQLVKSMKNGGRKILEKPWINLEKTMGKILGKFEENLITRKNLERVSRKS
jgi:hypothetical protein